MSRITIRDVRTSLGLTESYDIMNAIRNEATDAFQNYVPLASADNVTQVGQGLLQSQTLQNEFINALIDRIGLVVLRTVTLQNELKKFKKGTLSNGRTIQEIFVDIAKGYKYDAEDAEQTVFKREIPNVKTLYHELNRQDVYQQTVQGESLSLAFTSWSNFDTFVTGVMNAIYNAAEVDEYEYMKLAIDNYAAKNQFTIVPVAKPDTTTTTTELVKKIRATVGKMTIGAGSRNFNSMAVRTRTAMEDLHLIITADLRAEMDVDVLASAFNMGRTDFLGHVTVIDEFQTPGLEAVLVDYNFFQVYDKLQKMESIRNPKGLYWNYFYHVWQVISVSRFSNAVAFMSGDVPAVSAVIVDPVIAAIKQGRTHQFHAFVKSTDKQKHDVVWSVQTSKGTNTEVLGGTTVDNTGNLTVDEKQTGELSVTATVTYTEPATEEGAEPTTVSVVGESIVTIIPV